MLRPVTRSVNGRRVQRPAIGGRRRGPVRGPEAQRAVPGAVAPGLAVPGPVPSPGPPAPGAAEVGVPVVAGAPVVPGAAVVPGVALAPGGTGVGPAAIGGGGTHVDRVTAFVSSVTAALRASARPSSVAPVVIVIAVSARMFPTKLEDVPIVAELPTCQKTLHAWADPISSTRLAEAVSRVEPAWKMKTAFGSPPPSRVRVPLSPIVGAVYTPAGSVRPTRSAGTAAVDARPAAST